MQLELNVLTIVLQIFEYWLVWLGLRRGVFTFVGWQVTLCDPLWQVTLRIAMRWNSINTYTALPLPLPLQFMTHPGALSSVLYCMSQHKIHCNMSLCRSLKYMKYTIVYRTDACPYFGIMFCVLLLKLRKLIYHQSATSDNSFCSSLCAAGIILYSHTLNHLLRCGH